MKLLEKELSPEEVLSFDEFVIHDELCHRSWNDAHFSPRGVKLFVDHYGAGQFVKRYTEFSKFNSGMSFEKFVHDLNMAIGVQKWDDTVKVYGVSGSPQSP